MVSWRTQLWVSHALKAEIEVEGAFWIPWDPVWEKTSLPVRVDFLFLLKFSYVYVYVYMCMNIHMFLWVLTEARGDYRILRSRESMQLSVTH